MLPAAARLRRREDFTATVRRGRRASRGGVVICLLPAAPTGPSSHAEADPRVGFAVSRAVGGSVVRHRVARRLRHLMLDRLDRLPTGSRLVVRALPTAALRSSAALGSDLDAALGRVLASRQ